MLNTDEARSTSQVPPIVTVRDLDAMGIRFSKSYLHAMIKDGKFPAPFQLGPNKNAWKRQWVEEWLEQRIATREQPRNNAHAIAAGKASVAARRASGKLAKKRGR